jgi:tight adherence protein B
VLGFVAGAIVTAGLTGSLVVALAAGAAAAWSPVALARSRRMRRRRGFREAWPDAIATLIASVRAGVSLPEACASLLSRGPLQLRPGFEAFSSSYRATGSFQAALTRLRAELADPVADRVALALSMAHEVGGTDLVRVLRTLADFVREDLRVRKEIESRWSWTVSAARVAAAAPWVVLVMMSLRPEAAAAYDSAAGATVIGVGAAATFIGYRLMLRAARLPEDSRVGL